jgi:hypothetical protein
VKPISNPTVTLMRCTRVIGGPIIKRSPSRKTLIARYSCHISIKPLLIESDSQEVDISHEKQIISRKKLIILLLNFYESKSPVSYYKTYYEVL